MKIFSDEDFIDVFVQKVIVNPGFKTFVMKNDIAILELVSEVPITVNIHPICLPYNLQRLDLSGKKAMAAGWGYEKPDGKRSPILKQVEVPIWNDTDCENAYKKEIDFTKTYMCAGSLNGMKDTCSGDSGGPLTLLYEGQYYLIGIISTGKNCTERGSPGIYTRMTEFLNWFDENIKE